MPLRELPLHASMVVMRRYTMILVLALFGCGEVSEMDDGAPPSSEVTPESCATPVCSNEVAFTIDSCGRVYDRCGKQCAICTRGSGLGRLSGCKIPAATTIACVASCSECS